MAISEREFLPEAQPEEEHVTCPPHHWVISESYNDGYREQHWACRRCGDTKFIRNPVWASTGRKMNNTSTWTPEDRIIGGDEDGNLL